MVAISGPYMRPVVRQQGFYVAPGKMTLVSVKVEETFTTPEALSFFPAAARKCYQDDIERPVEESEFQPKYFNRKTAFKYTMDNCLYTSMIDKIMTNCNCTPNFAIIGGYHSVGLTNLVITEHIFSSWTTGKSLGSQKRRTPS